MVVPTSLFSAAAQNADPSHHRYLDRCASLYSTDSVAADSSRTASEISNAALSARSAWLT
jgi:hypothetical protein